MSILRKAEDNPVIFGNAEDDRVISRKELERAERFLRKIAR